MLREYESLQMVLLGTEKLVVDHIMHHMCTLLFANTAVPRDGPSLPDLEAHTGQKSTVPGATQQRPKALAARGDWSSLHCSREGFTLQENPWENTSLSGFTSLVSMELLPEFSKQDVFSYFMGVHQPRERLWSKISA